MITVTRMLRATFGALTPAQLIALPIVIKELSGQALAPEDCWTWNDFGSDTRIWVFGEDKQTRFELWTGGARGILIDVDGPRLANVEAVAGKLHNLAMDAARFSELEAAWSVRKTTAIIAEDYSL